MTNCMFGQLMTQGLITRYSHVCACSRLLSLTPTQVSRTSKFHPQALHACGEGRLCFSPHSNRCCWCHPSLRVYTLPWHPPWHLDIASSTISGVGQMAGSSACMPMCMIAPVFSLQTPSNQDKLPVMFVQWSRAINTAAIDRLPVSILISSQTYILHDELFLFKNLLSTLHKSAAITTQLSLV